MWYWIKRIWKILKTNRDSQWYSLAIRVTNLVDAE